MTNNRSPLQGIIYRTSAFGRTWHSDGKPLAGTAFADEFVLDSTLTWRVRCGGSGHLVGRRNSGLDNWCHRCAFGWGEAMGAVFLAASTNLPEVAIIAGDAWTHSLGLAVGNILGVR